MTDRRRAFKVVDDFEAALAEYTGAPYAVTVDSCTNALYLALKEQRVFEDAYVIVLPKNTYVGVYFAAENAGCHVKWRDEKWEGSYKIHGTCVIDSAKRFERDMYQPGTLTCLSFQAAKRLPIGRGGAILCDNEYTAEWLKRARLDGRTAGTDYQDNTYGGYGHHMYLTPPDAARGLWLMTYLDDDDPCDWTAYPDLSQATWT